MSVNYYTWGLMTVSVKHTKLTNFQAEKHIERVSHTAASLKRVFLKLYRGGSNTFIQTELSMVTISTIGRKSLRK